MGLNTVLLIVMLFERVSSTHYLTNVEIILQQITKPSLI